MRAPLLSSGLVAAMPARCRLGGGATSTSASCEPAVTNCCYAQATVSGEGGRPRGRHRCHVLRSYERRSPRRRSSARCVATEAPIRLMNGVSLFLSAALTDRSPSIATPASSFEELGVSSAVAAALARRGITTPLPIQARTLPDALTGRDVLGRAETGSGKTLAFGLPLLIRTAAGSAGRPGRQGRRGPRALVLVPTRELARQVHDELAPLAAPLGLRLLAVLLRQGACSLDAVEVAVLDEADHMADLGFLPAVT